MARRAAGAVEVDPDAAAEKNLNSAGEREIEPDRDGPSLAEMYREDHPDEVDDDDTGESTDLDGDEGPDDKAGDEKAADGKDATPPADSDEAKRYETFGRNWDAAFQQDPIGAFKRLASRAMSPDQVAALVASLGGQPAAAAAQGAAPPAEGESKDWDKFDWSKYEAATDLEEAVAPLVPQLRAVPAAVKELSEVDDSLYLQGLALTARLEALEDALDARMPALDMQAFWAHVKAHPNASWEEAVKAVYAPTVKTAVATVKQRNVARPETPRNGSARSQQRGPKKYASLLDAWNDDGSS